MNTGNIAFDVCLHLCCFSLDSLQPIYAPCLLLCAMILFSFFTRSLWALCFYYSIRLYSEWFYQYHNGNIISNEWCFWQITLNLTAFAMLVSWKLQIFLHSIYHPFFPILVFCCFFNFFCSPIFSSTHFIRVCFNFVFVEWIRVIYWFQFAWKIHWFSIRMRILIIIAYKVHIVQSL